MSIEPGSRTIFFGVVALVFLTLGLALCLWFPVPGRDLFGAFSIAVGVITGTIAAKHGVESLATGGGIAGVKSALMTDRQPGGQQPPTGGTP